MMLWEVRLPQSGEWVGKRNTAGGNTSEEVVATAQVRQKSEAQHDAMEPAWTLASERSTCQPRVPVGKSLFSSLIEFSPSKTMIN